MSAIRILLGIICFVIISISNEFSGRVLSSYELRVMGYGGLGYGLRVMGYGVGCPSARCLGTVCLCILSHNPKHVTRNTLTVQSHNPQHITRNRLTAQAHNPQHITRNTLIKIATSQLGIREATGNNDGTQVEAYLKATNLLKGNPWCAAFVSWVFKQAGLAQPRTAWSPTLFPLVRQTLTPQPADVLGIYSNELKRIAHAGLVEGRQNNWIISIEGNTNNDGSREGNGVYRKWRHIRTIAKFANWVSVVD